MKSKAHSKKCVDLGISVGLIDEQDTEESGKPHRWFPGCFYRCQLSRLPIPFIYLCCRLPTVFSSAVSYLLLLPHYGGVSLQTYKLTLKCLINLPKVCVWSCWSLANVLN